jgi:hypothetical protein
VASLWMSGLIHKAQEISSIALGTKAGDASQLFLSFATGTNAKDQNSGVNAYGRSQLVVPH